MSTITSILGTDLPKDSRAVINTNFSNLNTDKAEKTGKLSQFASTSSLELKGVISDETGSGSLVFANSPTLVTPALGTPSSGNLTNCIDLPLAGLVDISTNRILGRSTAGTGAVEELNVTSVPALIGLGTSDSPQFTGVNVGHATDTTITRVSAGIIAVEGVNVPTISSTDTLTNKTMTGATNTLTASVLKSATTEINVSSATAPSSGQVLTATSSTTATWQTPSSGTFKGCRVKQSSAQSIGTTLVAVAFDAETFDTDTMHDNVTNNSRITFTTAGYYQISGALNTDANAAAQVGIRLNGSTYIFLTSVGNTAASLANGPTVSTIYQFSASDYIEMMGYFGSTNNTKTGENGTHLSVAKVG